MAENNENKESKNKDKVGDLLRKERLTRRITIETIAKDLKLNVGYIKALEASDYNSLPPDPYVRVYIRSLTKYLSLDANNILKEIYKERGIISDETAENPAGKIDVRIRQQEKNSTAIVVAALIAVVVVFAFIANKKGWITPLQDPTAAAVEEKTDTSVFAITNQDAVMEQSTDSLLTNLNAPESAASKLNKMPPKP